MGNAIKNFERKKRREQKKTQQKNLKIVHNAIMRKYGFPNSFREQENEIFDYLNSQTDF